MDDKDLQTPFAHDESQGGIPRNIIMPRRAQPAASPMMMPNAAAASTEPEAVSSVVVAPVSIAMSPEKSNIPQIQADAVVVPEPETVAEPASTEQLPIELRTPAANIAIAEGPVAQVPSAPEVSHSVPTSPVSVPVAEPAVTAPSTQRLSYEPITEKPVPQDPLPDVQIPALRTYKNDISHTVETDKITTAKIMLAEQRQQDKVVAQVPETSVRKPRNVFALLSGIVLMVAAVGIVGYFGYMKLGTKAPNVALPQASFFLFAFDGDEFVNAAQNKNEIMQAADAAVENVRMTAKDNTYTELIFYKTNPDTEQSNRVTANEFFKLYDVELPTNIARSISTEFAYGLYKTAGSAEPFVVIGLVDYESAYDSMFAWEPTLAIDMREFFPNLMKIFGENPAVPADVPVVVSTSTATTTASSTISSVASTTVRAATSTTATTTPVATSTVPAYAPINRNVQFVDVVLSNRDTRALRDENGTPYFYYAFIDRDKILFAQDPKLIPDIIRKIREKQLVR